MRNLRFLLSALAVSLLASMLGPVPARAEVDVYITPGTHDVNGRQWRTVCEPYSQTKRCTTEIWATQVSQVGGRFVQKNGWVFNNLTYAESPRLLWASNPLAAGGVIGGEESWTSSDGRKWRTECDTATTGRNGCRSYIEATVIESYKTSKGSQAFRWVTSWIFNNMVRFDSGPGVTVSYPSAPPMTVAPAFLKGRRYFTLGMIVTQPNSGTEARGSGRLSNIELDPNGQLGTFRESYWTYGWEMAANERDYGQFRASIPNAPTGCLTTSYETADRTLLGLPQLAPGKCDVRTARSFLADPTIRYGTYEAIQGSDGNRIKLYWNNSRVTETYFDATASGQTYSELRLTTQTHPDAVSAIGFMFGSTKPRGAGRSFIPEISKPQWRAPRSVSGTNVSQSIFPYDAGGPDNTLWTQNFGTSALAAGRQAFRFQDYQATGNSCIVTPASVRGRVDPTGWHSYMCPLPSDGKVVWHHMASSLVAEAHRFCPVYVAGTSADAHYARCNAAGYQVVDYTMPARAGGHVNEILQAVDDNDRLVALVGLESSLYSHKANSKSQLALFAAVAPGY